MKSPEAIERNRDKSRERYYTSGRADKHPGPLGGARLCTPGCTCNRHPPVRCRGLATAVREDFGVWRISCANCGRIAGNFDEKQVTEILNKHRHRKRYLVRKKMK